ncbi:MAG: hypothetical protein PHI91_03505 [Candidatus Pacebacteria bacterium]|nr:hypothetical protein [Candidatus Paceibacterota bacterium]MDD2757632.1 hypothetical protein [Candidatus Paceibacterota bacterium]MDD3283581.1 hypothetical protein [Candidatus Paceibacterota bacterium]MDD3970224.1 hypothetical protein [Candidatus Paceibacterota bacterium]MDD4738251.1 hypothetical protein [Candidatus Paceibacterota bacterium]
MKKINDKIIAFLGEIILKNNLEKDVIDSSFDYSERTPILEKTLSMIFNDVVTQRMENGERIAQFHPFVKLRNIIDRLINNLINYEDVLPLLKEEFDFPKEKAKEISLLIEGNKEIKELIEKEDDTVYEKTEEKVSPKSIGYELLK